jgi:hypothetical protein
MKKVHKLDRFFIVLYPGGVWLNYNEFITSDA